MFAGIQRSVELVFIWSNEKNFTVEAVTNTQNDRLSAHASGDFIRGYRTYLCTMKSDEMMVWASDGSKFNLVFTKKGVKVNTQVYIKTLAEKVIPWITEIF